MGPGTVAITAERKASEFRTALQRHGAEVWHAPTMHIIELGADERLRAATDAVLEQAVDLAVVTTGQGFNGWLSAAGERGLGQALLARLRAAEILVRGPKATGAVRAHGLAEQWAAPQETAAEIRDHLLARGVVGARIAVQVHGGSVPELTDALAAGGAEIIEVAPYRWVRPDDVAAVYRLIDASIAGEIDVLAFTSAPAAANLLTLAAEHGRRDELLDALRTRVCCACVGPVTAAPLVEQDVPVITPERQRLGALVKLIGERLAARPG